MTKDKLKWSYMWSKHSRRTWVFACSWIRHDRQEWSGTLGFGKWSLHVFRRVVKS